MGGHIMVTQSKAIPALNLENLHRGGWLIEDVDIEKWGTEAIVQAIFDPDLPDTSRFKLVFSKCLTLTWDTEGNEFDKRDLQADVIGFEHFDEGKYKKTVITADLFTLVITYHEIDLQKNG
jgi:hypothetical protein